MVKFHPYYPPSKFTMLSGVYSSCFGHRNHFNTSGRVHYTEIMYSKVHLNDNVSKAILKQAWKMSSIVQGEYQLCKLLKLLKKVFL